MLPYVDENNTYKKIEINHYNILILPTVINQYFNENIFYNMNILSPEKKYILFKILTEDERQEIRNRIRETGIPDIIIGNVNLEEFFTIEELRNTKYTKVKEIYSYNTYKNKLNKSKHRIYIKNTLLTELKR